MSDGNQQEDTQNKSPLRVRAEIRQQNINIRRETRKAQARANRDAARDRIQKEKDNLFNGGKKQLSTSTTTDTYPTPNRAHELVKFTNKDKRGGLGDGGSTYDDTELRDLIDQINARLDAATIDAVCSGSGDVTVTLNL